MKLDIIEGLFDVEEEKGSFLDSLFKKYNYKGRMPKGMVHISYYKMVQLIKNSIYYETFIKSLEELNEDLIYKSEIHGIGHNIRVAILITGISVLEGVSLDDYKVLIYGALYHDIGRNDDNVDCYHGLRSARMLKDIGLDLDSSDKRLLQLICMYHSINDEFINLSKVKSIDIERLKRLIRILKDADAIDRIRVNALDIRYLRSYTSLSLVHAAYDLLANYEKLSKDNQKVLS